MTPVVWPEVSGSRATYHPTRLTFTLYVKNIPLKNQYMSLEALILQWILDPWK